MKNQTPHNLQWWLTHLEGVVSSSDGWMALCPAHSDVNPSLHITDQDGQILIHCFAGCKYQDILLALEEGPSIQVTPTINSQNMSPGVWWEEYTQIPWSEWESWGVREVGEAIGFHWGRRSNIQKLRQTNSKTFFWEPRDAANPPLWPYPENLPSSQIWITEGESDCGVLRHLGFSNAFATTRGAGTKKNLNQVWSSIKDLGIEEVIILFDTDSAGVLGSNAIKQTLQEVGIDAISLDLFPLLDPLLGEKDLRDLWCRLKDPKKLKMQLETLLRQSQASRQSSKDLFILEDFISIPVTPENWLVKKTWLQETVGMIVGFPKVGKSWLALDLGISIASQTPFLNHFDVDRSGPVVILTKEDPDYLLQDRLTKILISKGLGGQIQKDKGKYRVNFPSRKGFPLYLDLSREFLFTPQKSQELMVWLQQIQSRHGDLSLVIFDPILRMLSETDEFKASEVNTSVFATTAMIQREFGAGSVLVHHRSKAAGKAKASYGSIAFHAFSENTIYVLGDGPDTDGWVYAKNEFKSSAEYNWKFRFLDLDKEYKVEVAEVSSQQKLGTGRQIYNLLQSLSPEGLLVQEMSEAFEDLSDYMIREILKQLKGENLIYKEKDPASLKGGPRPDRWFARSKKIDS